MRHHDVQPDATRCPPGIVTPEDASRRETGRRERSAGAQGRDQKQAAVIASADLPMPSIVTVWGSVLGQNKVISERFWPGADRFERVLELRGAMPRVGDGDEVLEDADLRRRPALCGLLGLHVKMVHNVLDLQHTSSTLSARCHSCDTANVPAPPR